MGKYDTADHGQSHGGALLFFPYSEGDNERRIIFFGLLVMVWGVFSTSHRDLSVMGLSWGEKKNERHFFLFLSTLQILRYLCMSNNHDDNKQQVVL